MTGIPVMGAERVMTQDSDSTPTHSNRSREPRCHASTKELWIIAVAAHRDLRGLYRLISFRIRSGSFSASSSHTLNTRRCFRRFAHSARRGRSADSGGDLHLAEKLGWNLPERTFLRGRTDACAAPGAACAHTIRVLKRSFGNAKGRWHGRQASCEDGSRRRLPP